MADENLSTSSEILSGEGISFVGNPEVILDRYIEEAKYGKPLEFVVTTCPDYSYRKDSSNSGTAKYTFEDIGEDAGLVALGIMNTMLPVVEHLETEGAYNRLTFAYADNEAYDPQIRIAMGIGQEDFLARINSSGQKLFLRLHQEYMQRCMGTYSVPSVAMMSEVMREDTYNRSTEILHGIKNGTVDGIKLARLGLYSAWFGNYPGLNNGNPIAFDSFAKERARKDIFDHVHLGESLRDITKGVDGIPSTSRNIVIVTMSDVSLARFFNFSGRYPHVPVIRVEKNY